MTSPLDDYNRKRNFDRTAEPPGTAAPRDDGAAGGCDGRLRFAVQHHLASRDHCSTSTSGSHQPSSHSMTVPPPYSPCGMVPSKVR